MNLKKIYTILLLLLLTTGLQAHTVFMRNGDVIVGDIIESKESYIVIKQKDGKKIRLLKTKIMKISYMDGEKEKIITNKQLMNKEKTAEIAEIIHAETTISAPKKPNLQEVIQEAKKNKKEFPSENKKKETTQPAKK